MIRYRKIIDAMIDAHNNTYNSSVKNLCSREYYEKLLNDVLKILKENKDCSLSDVRNKLYEKSGLDSALREFFLSSKKAPGAVISFGTDKYQEKIVIGNKQEVLMDSNGVLIPSVKEMKENTIFDLASCTKLFTSVAILQLAGDEQLRLDDNIRLYLPEFKNLGNHTIFDLLTYQPYHTDRRIDEAKSVEEAESILFTAMPYTPSECIFRDRYNDIAPMILKYIVEKVSGLSFEEYVKLNILDNALMSNTFVCIPEDKKEMVANSNYNGIINSNGEFTIRSNAYPGISTDPKAVALGQPLGKLPGHAGLFSTVDDMVSFSKGLINGLVLHPALTYEMAQNRTYSLVRSSSGIEYVPTYGFLCGAKNPNSIFSSVYRPLSGSSFSKTGWSGTQITIDPINHINLAFLSNRTHNRIVSILGNHDNIFTLKRGVRTTSDDKGNIMIDSSIYGFDRTTITNACLELALKEKLLEEIIGKKMSKEKEDVKVRYIK